MEIKVNINVCRACKKSETGNSMLENTDLLKKFISTTQLKVKTDDQMPKILCSKCILKLKIAYDFREMAILSDKQLRTFLFKINKEFRETTQSSKSSATKSLTEPEEEEMQLLLDDDDNDDDEAEQESCHNSQSEVEFTEILINEDLENTIDSEEQDNEDEDETMACQPVIEQVQEDEEEENYPVDNGDESENVQYIDDDDMENTIQLFDDDDDRDEDDNQNDDDTNENEFLGEIHVTEDSIVIEENEDTKSVLNIQVETIEQHDVKLPPMQRKPKSATKSATTGRGRRSKNNPDPLKKFDNKSFFCIKCNKDFSTKTNLMRHTITHDGIKPYQCTICGNSFTQNTSLKQHMLIHTGERPHQCKVCGRGFTQSKSLTFHMRRHTGEKPFICDVCNIQFRQRDGLKRHYQVKHSAEPTQEFNCTLCNRVLHSKYSLQIHMKKHFDRPDHQSFKCDDCDKVFSTKASLDSHALMHTGQRPFSCQTCNKQFARKTSLLQHTKLHNNDVLKEEEDELKDFELSPSLSPNNSQLKQFQCGKCFKSFSIKRNLLQHLRNHNPELMNLYSCDDCAIAFDTKRALKLHRHSEHKETVSDLNECDYCNIPFITVNDLNDHIASVHDAIDEECVICFEKFTSIKLLEDHLLEHELVTIA